MLMAKKRQHDTQQDAYNKDNLPTTDPTTVQMVIAVGSVTTDVYCTKNRGKFPKER
jgi:hypothetical protein